MTKTKECQSSHTNLANKIEISQCALIHRAYENAALERLYWPIFSFHAYKPHIYNVARYHH